MMKINAKNLGVLTLLAVLMVEIVSISGCICCHRLNIPEIFHLPGGFSYEVNITETQGNPNQAVLDGWIQPKLVNIFGEAKLVSSTKVTYMGANAAKLEYVVPRKIKEEDVNKLRALIENEVNDVAHSEVSSNTFEISYIENNGERGIVLTGDMGGQTITVVGWDKTGQIL